MDWLSQFLGGLNQPQGGYDFGGLGGAMEPQADVPLPIPRPSSAPSTEVSTSGPLVAGGGSQMPPQGGDFSSKLIAGLRGVQAPPGRDVVKPSTPAAPRPTNAIRGGELFAVLQALSQPGGGQQPRLIPTLGQSVGTGRY